MSRGIMTTEMLGPYPHHKGDFCGNYLPGEYEYEYNLYEVSNQHPHKAWLGRMRFGKPRDCEAGTSEEMAKEGFVGLYLKEDGKLMPWEIEVPTPPELKEPV